ARRRSPRGQRRSADHDSLRVQRAVLPAGVGRQRTWNPGTHRRTHAAALQGGRIRRGARGGCGRVGPPHLRVRCVTLDLEKLREQSGLRLDKEGRFWHRGSEVTHARTLAVLHRGIHRAPDGRWATRIGKDWAYLDVQDVALWIRRVDGDRAQLASGEWVAFDPSTLASGEGDALYARVGGERARLTRAAQLSLADRLHEEDGGYALETGGKRFRIGRDGGPEPVRQGS